MAHDLEPVGRFRQMDDDGVLETRHRDAGDLLPALVRSQVQNDLAVDLAVELELVRPRGKPDVGSEEQHILADRPVALPIEADRALVP